jgi:MYXO-CTERM domain-containing protein
VVGGKSNCVAPQQCNKQDGTIGQCVTPTGGGEAGPIGDEAGVGLNDAGSIQGGGCSCRTTMPISGSPIALVGAALGALLVAKRRRDRKSNEKVHKQADHESNDKERG